MTENEQWMQQSYPDLPAQVTTLYAVWRVAINGRGECERYIAMTSIWREGAEKSIRLAGGTLDVISL